ncbi:MAG: 4'-phosphopantetheinyl transferase superfamily protein [Methylomicrobium sp.]|nr:4'-phosphopantetheinyl transferase superfamily protein [Methylomicrobium sp.]
MTEATLKPGCIEIEYGKLYSINVLNRNYYDMLSDSERANAMQRRTVEMQNRYVEIHAKKRLALAEFLKCKPETLVFAAEANGKPYLPDYPDWTFNLSHSGDYFALAVARQCRLGIDLEAARSRSNLAGIVKKCFAIEEIAYWEALPEVERVSAFYRFWTRKEAFVKATGRGIVLGLNRCVVDPNGPDRMLRVPEEFAPASDWRIACNDWKRDIFCAVVIDRAIEKIQWREIV